MRIPNPYRPGFNQMPAVLAGRDRIVAAAAEAVDVAALDARTPRPLVITGTRGVGKTVVLEQARHDAAAGRSWLSAAVEVPPGGTFLPALTAALAQVRAAYEHDTPRRGSRWRLEKATLRAGPAFFGAQAEIARTPDAGTLDLREQVQHLMDVAVPMHAGVLITVDEAHLADKAEFAHLAAVLQHAAGQDWPLAAIIAGLPSLRSPHRMVTYLERAEWHTLGLLTPEQARQALTGPAREAGRPMGPDAARLLTDAAGGYPYAIQVFGHHAWRASHGQDTITPTAAAAAIPEAEHDLGQGLYAARWDDAGVREKEYLTALARLLAGGAKPTGADVARALDQPAQALSYLRERLLKKGTVYTEGRALRFAVPGMAAWILNHTD